MKKKKLLYGVLGLLLIGSVAACSVQTSTTNELTDLSSTIVGNAEYDGINEDTTVVGEQFTIYEQYGLKYDASKNELAYNGKLVRWFEDYYPLDGDNQAGVNFFNENGVIDVYAVRDFTTFAQDEYGAFDPRGELLGLKEFSQDEFNARNIDAIKNPYSAPASSGSSLSTEEIDAMLAEYKNFGVTYNTANDQWYFNGEEVRYFRDVLTSNGESLSSGKFRGSMRTLGNGNGTIDIYAVRDFNTLNADGNGTLTDIKAYTQQEFDEHTQANFSNNDNYSSNATR